jgi:hypothetical protein
MPYSYAVYTGNGSTTQFNVTFPYIRREHVFASIDYVNATFTWVNNTTIAISPAPGNGTRVEVRRVTPVNTPLVDFADGSTLVAADLDTNALQQTYINQEQDDQFADGISINSQGLLDAGGKRITDVGDPTSAQDAATKTYVDTFVSQTANIANGAVTTAKIADGAVTTAKIADDNVTTGKIANSNVTTAKIADSNVTTAKIADSNVTTAKIADSNVTTVKIADSNVTTAKIADGNVTSAKIADGNVTTGKIADANVTEAKLATGAVTSAKIADGTIATADIGNSQVTGAKIADDTITSAKLTGATVVTNSELSGSTPNDTSFFTTSASDARYFRQDSSETITSGNPWSSSDSYVATTAAIDARVIDLVDDVGGFVPIENETSFPVANPDINNPDGTGTIVSIKEMVTSRTPVAGTVTIANGSGGNTVTITGCGSTVLASGFGVLVETTATLHTYAFHRLVPKATEVTTVAGISSDVTTVAGISSDVTAVASNATNVTTVATNITNVNNVGGSITNVNSVASNLGTVNDFAARYRVAATDPTTSLDTGDLVFNTGASELRVYNGSAWQGGVTATGNLMSKSGDTMTGPLGITTGTNSLPSLFFSGDPNTGLYSPGADQLGITTGGVARLTVAADGTVNVVGSLTKGGSAVVTVGDTGTVTSTMILDDTILNADINASAAIAGTKVAPDFGSQNVVTTGTATAASLNPTGSSVPTNGVYLPAANSVAISTNGTGRLFIDSSGRALVGTSTARTSVGIGSGFGLTPQVQVESSGSVQAASPLFLANANSALGPELILGKTRATSAGGNTVVQSGDALGSVVFAGADGTDIASSGASIFCYVDGTPGNDDMPGRLVFSTTADSASSPTERMRIDSSGRVGIGTTPASQGAGNNHLQVHSGSSAAYFSVTNSTTGASADTNGFNIVQVGLDSYLLNRSNGALLLLTNGNERARIDSSGRLLVGTSSGIAGTNVNIYSGSSTAAYLTLAGNAEASPFYIGQDSSGLTRIFQDGNKPITFWTGSAASERMRINSTGDVMIGCITRPSSGNVTGVFIEPGIITIGSTTSAGQDRMRFETPSGRVGSISTSGSATAYNTSSDYRLKENVTKVTDGIARLQQLKPSRFNFIADRDKTVDGFIAHEAQAVVPECVTGEKDAVDADGNPVYQGIDQSKLVPLLTAALQEAIGRIEALEAEVTALKAQ